MAALGKWKAETLHSLEVEPLASEETERTLSFGDIVSLFSVEHHGYISSDGFSDDLCCLKKVLQTSTSTQALAPQHFESCVFEIVPRFKYDMQVNLEDLLSTYGRERASIGVYEEEDPEIEQQLRTLQQQEEFERAENVAESTRTAGKTVTYGQVVQLRHVKSKRFVSLTIKEAPELEKNSLRVILEAEGSEGSWFLVVPRLKMRSEGDPVQLGDQVTFISKKFNVFLHCAMQTSRSEICGSTTSASWRITPYAPYTPPTSAKFIKAGDVVRIFHKEIEGFLTSEYTVNEFSAPGTAPSTDATTSTKLFFASQLTPQQSSGQQVQQAASNSNSLWHIELENTMRGGNVTFDHCVRFKHIPSGKYLASELYNDPLATQPITTASTATLATAQSATLSRATASPATLTSSSLATSSSTMLQSQQPMAAPKRSATTQLTRAGQSSVLARQPSRMLASGALPASLRVFLTDDPNDDRSLFRFNTPGNIAQQEDNVELDSFLRIRHRDTQCWLHAAANTASTPKMRKPPPTAQQAEDLAGKDSNEKLSIDVDLRSAYYDSDVFVLTAAPPSEVHTLYQVLGEITYLRSYLATLTRAAQHSFYVHNERMSKWLSNDTAKLSKVLIALIESCKASAGSKMLVSSSQREREESAPGPLETFDLSNTSLPNIAMQNLLREQNIGDVLIAILARMFKTARTTEEMENFCDQPENYAFVNVCRLSYTLLRHLATDNEENRTYLSKYVPFMFSQIGVPIKAASTLMELYKHNFQLCNSISEATLEKVLLEHVAERPILRYVRFLGVLCECNGVPIPKNQDFIAKYLIHDRPTAFFPIRTNRSSQISTSMDDLQFRVPTKDHFKWLPLADFADSHLHSSKSMSYLIESVELLSQLCFGGNTNTSAIITRHISPRTLIKCFSNGGLPPSLRAAFCRLFVQLLLSDKEMAKPISFINYTRLWSDIREQTTAPASTGASSGLNSADRQPTVSDTIASNLASSPSTPTLRKGTKMTNLMATPFSVLPTDLQDAKKFVLEYLESASSSPKGPGSEANHLIAEALEMARHLFTFGRFNHEETLLLAPLLLKLCKQHTFAAPYLYYDVDEKSYLNISPFERSSLTKPLMDFKFSAGQILDMICDYRINCRLTQLLGLYKSTIHANTSSTTATGRATPEASSLLGTTGVLAQLGDAVKKLATSSSTGDDMEQILKLMAIDDTLYIPVLSDFILHHYPSLSNIGARLLTRHYDQRQEMLDALRNVQILADPELVVTYRSASQSLNALKRIISSHPMTISDVSREQDAIVKHLDLLLELVALPESPSKPTNPPSWQSSSSSIDATSASSTPQQSTQPAKTMVARIHEHQRLLLNLHMDDIVLDLMQTEVAKVSYFVMSKCYDLLKSMCQGPFHDGQESLFKQMAVFLEHIEDDELSLHAAYLIEAIFEGNRQLASEVTEVQLRKIVNQIARKKLPVYLNILKSLAVIDGKPYKRLQTLIVKLILEKQQDVVVLYNDVASLRRRNEMIKSLHFLDPDSELVYYLRLLELFVITCQGKVYEAEVKCQSLFSLDDILFQVSDRMNWPEIKAAFVSLLEEAYIVTERNLKNIAHASQIWDLIDVFVRDIQAHTKHELTTLRPNSQRPSLQNSSMVTAVTGASAESEAKSNLGLSRATSLQISRTPSPLLSKPEPGVSGNRKAPTGLRRGMLQVQPELLQQIDEKRGASDEKPSDGPKSTGNAVPRLMRRETKMSSPESLETDTQSPQKSDSQSLPTEAAQQDSTTPPTSLASPSSPTPPNELGAPQRAVSMYARPTLRRVGRSPLSPSSQPHKTVSWDHDSIKEDPLDDDKNDAALPSTRVEPTASPSATESTDTIDTPSPKPSSSSSSSASNSDNESSSDIDEEEEERRSAARLAAARARDAAIMAQSEKDDAEARDIKSELELQENKTTGEAQEPSDEPKDDDKDNDTASTTSSHSSSSSDIDDEEEERRAAARLAASRARDAAIMAQSDSEPLTEQIEPTSQKKAPMTIGEPILAKNTINDDDKDDNTDDDASSSSSASCAPSSSSDIDEEEEERRSAARLAAARARDAAILEQETMVDKKASEEAVETKRQDDDKSQIRVRHFYDSERKYLFDGVLPFLRRFCSAKWMTKRFDSSQLEKLSELVDAVYTLTEISDITIGQVSNVTSCIEAMMARGASGQEHKDDINTFLRQFHHRQMEIQKLQQGIGPRATQQDSTNTTEKQANWGPPRPIARSPLTTSLSPPASPSSPPFRTRKRAESYRDVGNSIESSEAVTQGLKVFQADCTRWLRPENEIMGLASLFKKDIAYLATIAPLEGTDQQTAPLHHPTVVTKLLAQLGDPAYSRYLPNGETVVTQILKAMRVLLVEPRVAEEAAKLEPDDSNDEPSEVEYSFPGISKMFKDSIESGTFEMVNADKKAEQKDPTQDSRIPAWLSLLLLSFGHLGEAISKSIIDEENTHDSFDELLTKTQMELDSLGLTRLLAKLLTSGSDSIAQECIRCSIALLWGGNSSVQAHMLQLFQQTAQQTQMTFHELRARMRRGMAEIEERRELHRKHHLELEHRHEKNSEATKDEESTPRDTAPKLAGTGGSVDESLQSQEEIDSQQQQKQESKYLAKMRRDMKAIEELLRFLQLLCEGHNQDLQKYLRHQLHSLQSYDLVTETALYLEALDRHVDEETVRATIQTFTSLTEYCQGPCVENQHVLAKTKLCESVNYLLHETNVRCGRLETLQLHGAMLTTLLSLLEGVGNNPYIPRHLLAALDLNQIEKNVQEIVTEVATSLARLGRDTPGNSTSAWGAKSKSIFDSSDLPEETQAQIECGYLYFFLLRTLNDHDPSDRISRLLQSFPHGNFFASGVGSLEIVRNGQLERVYFRIPAICSNLTSSSKDDLVRNVKRNNQQEKLEDMFERSEHLIVEMEHREALSKSTNFSWMASNEEALKNWSFVLSLFINFLIILFYSSSPTPTIDTSDDSATTTTAAIETTTKPWPNFTIPSWVIYAMLLLALGQLACSAITLFIYMVSYLPISIRKKWDAVPGWISSIKSPTHQSVLKSVYIALSDTYFMYYLFYLIFGLIGILQMPNAPFFFAFHLLDIIVRSELLKYVIKSVTANGKAIMLTACLALVVVYIYSIFGFLFFRSKFGSDAGCDSMLMCLVTSINMGLRSGGGIGDVMEPPTWSDPDTHWRILYDSTFFFLVIVIMLNIIFGIIIDTFGELRSHNNEIEEDIKNKCFICGIERETFDPHADGFERHIHTDHDVFHYIYFFMYLRHKERTEYTGPEQYVADMVDAKDLSFIPVLRALCLGEEHEEGGEKNEQILDGVKQLSQLTATHIEHMKKGLTKKQAEVDERLANEADKTEMLTTEMRDTMVDYGSRLEQLEDKIDKIMSILEKQIHSQSQTQLAMSKLALSMSSAPVSHPSSTAPIAPTSSTDPSLSISSPFMSSDRPSTQTPSLGSSLAQPTDGSLLTSTLPTVPLSASAAAGAELRPLRAPSRHMRGSRQMEE